MGPTFVERICYLKRKVPRPSQTHAISLLGVKGSARQGWVVDKAPTDHTSADQTPILYIPGTSPGLKPKGKCDERTLRRSQTGQTWLEL